MSHYIFYFRRYLILGWIFITLHLDFMCRLFHEKTLLRYDEMIISQNSVFDTVRMVYRLRYLPHQLNTKFYAVKIYRTGVGVSFVCRRYHISKSSLMRWNKKFDSTKESLMEQNNHATIDFLKRAIAYFGYQPKILQTDNGSEFTHTKKTDRTHPLDVKCIELEIEHKRIRPRTPWHNGKVERSHRNDQERFYNHMSFYSYDNLLPQAERYLKRSNANIPTFLFKKLVSHH